MSYSTIVKKYQLSASEKSLTTFKSISHQKPLFIKHFPLICKETNKSLSMKKKMHPDFCLYVNV